MPTTPPPRFDAPALFPDLAGLARTAVRLHPRRGPEPPMDASKIGGRILWPADEPWPECQYHDAAGNAAGNSPPRRYIFAAVLQLRERDVPELGFPPGKDVFQLLWCPNDHRQYPAPYCRAYWRAAADVTDSLARLPAPGWAEEWYVPKPCALHPERVTEYPGFDNLPEALQERVLAWQAELEERGEDLGDVEDGAVYEWELSVADGTKVVGYVNWIQGPEVPTCTCGRPMEHLLTVASGEFHGGNWRRWCPLEDQHVCRDAPYEERAAVQAATGLMLGDMGDMFLFICRACPEWPIDWVLQCC
jgi:hypothetical protein